MAYWEFLLQKEGDRSWLPLESPDVEILEGRYRVVARSNRVNTPVEVRVIHQFEDANLPKNRGQKRITKTNQDGLMVVLPFTWLQPGLWELRCSSDVMADMMGQGWQHTVQLDVQPQDSLLDDEDWSIQPDDSATAEPEATALQTVTVLQVSDPAPPEESSTQIQTAETTIQVPPSEPQATPAEDCPQAIPVRVQMDQDSYATRSAHPLVLTGRILPEPPSPASDTPVDDAFAPTPIPAHYIRALQVRLLNPQTGKVLVEQAIAQDVSELPFAFTCHVDSPEAAETHLLIGQLTILGEHGEVLAQQSFTVTTDLEALLQAIADDSLLNEAEDSRTLTSPFGTAEPPDLTLLNLISQANADAQFQVTNTEPIPPQLYYPEPTEEASHKSLDLPNFSTPTPTEEAAIAAEVPSTTDAPPEEASAIAPEPALTPGQTSPSPDLSAPLEGTVDQATPDLGLQLPAIAPSGSLPNSGQVSSAIGTANEPLTVSLSPTDLEFQALNLQDRFLARLSALASDADLQTWLRSQYPAPTRSQSTDQNGHAPNGTPTTLTSARPPSLEEVQTAREFVIDDEEAVPPSEGSSSDAGDPRGTPIPEPLKIPDDEPIPSPQLTLPDRDLVAGQPLQILVSLPTVRPRLSVKLWLQDPQTRDLLDGPYWLTTFIPNGHDQLESGLQVMVPFGCVALQFEAIAVEAATQRESRKTTVRRRVIPPDLSIPVMDDDIKL